jgi:hypothetical protein
MKIDAINCHQYTPWVYLVIAAIVPHTKVIFTEYGRFYPDLSGWKRRIVNPILPALLIQLLQFQSQPNTH